MLHFFGDSWPAAGGEIYNYLLKTQGIKTDSYPTMVGKILDMPVKNYAVSGSSQQHMIIQILSSNLLPGDHAIFSMTCPAREMYYNDQNQLVRTMISPNKDGINDYQDSWRSANVCFMLYHYCKSRQVHPWFINMFTVSSYEKTKHPLWDEIPEFNWLIPKHECIVQTDFDPAFFNRHADHRNSDYWDWLNDNNAQVQKYIRPCESHPNLEGKELIAKKIAKEIKKRMETISS